MNFLKMKINSTVKKYVEETTVEKISLIVDNITNENKKIDFKIAEKLNELLEEFKNNTEIDGKNYFKSNERTIMPFAHLIRLGSNNKYFCICHADSYYIKDTVLVQLSLLKDDAIISSKDIDALIDSEIIKFYKDSIENIELYMRKDYYLL